MCVFCVFHGASAAAKGGAMRPAEGLPLGLICHHAPPAAASSPTGGGRPHQPMLAVLRRQSARVPAATGGGAARRRPRQQQHQRTRCHNCSRVAHPATRTERSQHWCGVDQKHLFCSLSQQR